MMPVPPPQLDQRNAAGVLATLLGRAPAYVPMWRPTPGQPSLALLQIVARYMEVLLERLNAAPQKNRLAFLDLLGESLIPARGGRAPVVFTFTPPSTAPQASAPTVAPGTPAASVLATLALPPAPTPLATPEINVRVPAGTQLGAKAADGSQLVFETETDIGLTGATLSQVVSLWPGRDTYTDHTAALTGGKAFSLFTGGAVTPHMLYLADDNYLALKGQSTVEITFDLLSPGSQSLRGAVWEYWDGKLWHPFGDPDAPVATGVADLAGMEAMASNLPGVVIDGTDGMSRSGVILLQGDCIDTEKTSVDGVESHWIRCRLSSPLLPDFSRQDAAVKQIRINTVVQRVFAPTGGIDAAVDVGRLPPTAGLRPDVAFADATSLDLTKAFLPFGQAPTPGNTLYIACDEAFSKPGAEVRLAISLTPPAPQIDQHPTVSWEYWDGGAWRDLALKEIHNPFTTPGTRPDFTGNGLFGFTVPDLAVPPSTINGQTHRWIRARITQADYTHHTQVVVPLPPGTTPPPNPATLTIVEQHPPRVADLRIAYLYRSPRAVPAHCVTFNDFAYQDHTSDIRWPSLGFAPFHATADLTPSLYFGFDKALPVDTVSLYLDIQAAELMPPGPALTWEYWNGQDWAEIAVRDDTARLVQPGMLEFVGPADTAALARFSAPMHWVRGRLRDDGEPLTPSLGGVFPNAVWASQAQTFSDEPLGSGTGEPNQVFFLKHYPVLDGEAIEVRELDGPRAVVELPILERVVKPTDLRVISNPTGQTQVWVRWYRRPYLYFSGPQDRHYVLEPVSGRLLFGDGTSGRLLPAGTDNVRAHSYRAGGGVAGNIPAGAISQLLGGIPYVSGVRNPRPAEGGADSESLDRVAVRGPQVIRHRERALSAADYESLALEASAGVAVARALPATNPSGRPAPGWVKLIIVPNSQDPRPQPSLEMRREVQTFVQAHAPADLHGVFVSGPSYLPVGVDITIAPLDITQAGPIGSTVRQMLEAFFHPLTGGPNKLGWPFGRDVYLSDIAATLSQVAGLDSIQNLNLLLDGIVQDDLVSVPPDRIVVAGPMRIRVVAGA